MPGPRFLNRHLRLTTSSPWIPRRRRLTLWALASVLLLVTYLGRGVEPPATVAERPGTSPYRVTVGDRMRTFLLHVPGSRPRRFGLAAAYPLVILLHGSGANGAAIRRMSGMDSIADADHFLVAYPDGTTGALELGGDWNAGDCCGAAHRKNVGDVAFVRALVGALSRELPVDRRRIYVAGFSDGGRMAYRVGCDLGRLVAAIGVVSGSVVTSGCAPSRPVPLIAFHGTADDEVSYGDSSYSTAAGRMPAGSAGAPPSVVFWATANGCRSAGASAYSPHVSVMHFARCAADVVLYTVDGGGHAWPRGAGDGAEPTHELPASAVMWRFFAAHPLP